MDSLGNLGAGASQLRALPRRWIAPGKKGLVHALQLCSPLDFSDLLGPLRTLRYPGTLGEPRFA
jgi:hypothetical protein